MARIRSVKPALRTSRTVAKWPREIRYFWVLLWGYLDDLGRGLDIPKAIAGDCFPLDDDITPKTIDRWLSLMASTKTETKDAPVCRYEVGGVRYIHSLNWSEHQRPNRPSPSQHPPCPIHEELPADEAIDVDAWEPTDTDTDPTQKSVTERHQRPQTAPKAGQKVGTLPKRHPKTSGARVGPHPQNNRSP